MRKPLTATNLAELDSRDRRRKAVSSASAKTLDLLANDPDNEVRFAVANNTYTAPATLGRLGDDEKTSVRGAVARNPATEPATLVRLAGHVSAAVRAPAASNPNTPADTLRVLAADPWSPVSRSAMMNPSTPPDILAAAIVNPTDELAASNAAKNPSLPAHAVTALTRSGSESLRRAAAQHPNMLPADAAALVADPDPWVRLYVTRNTAAPAEALDTVVAMHLAEDGALLREFGDIAVATLAAAAEHRSLPPHLIPVLAGHPESEVRAAIAGRTDLDEYTRTVLVLAARPADHIR